MEHRWSQKKKKWGMGVLAAVIVFACFQHPVIAQEKDKKAKPSKRIEGTYVISRGDILEIVTWKEPDFSRPQVLVRTDGFISLPLINDVKAAGRTPMQLKKEIEKKLAAYVANPLVTVNVTIPDSQKFYVLGEVIRIGEYNLTKRLRVLQAFALAGGFTEWAEKDEIILLRQEGGKERIYRIDYKDLVKGENLEQNIELKANDTIIVP